MKCHMCGGKMREALTDLPFKTGDHAIIILKDLPVFQCEGCREYLIADPVMERVERLLAQASGGAELEVIRFAA